MDAIPFFVAPTARELRQRVRSANYRAGQNGLTGRLSVDDILKQYCDQRGTCHCGKFLYPNSTVKFEVDHVRAYYLGGDNWPNNINILCVSCNRKKGQKPLERVVKEYAARGIIHRYAPLFPDVKVQLLLPLVLDGEAA
jgi:5-methylcytosine-specific restriction endonuclease McrA